MDYVARITTEHSQYTESAPKRTRIHATAGRLQRAWINFPAGPAGLLHALIMLADHQVAPINRGQNYAGDDVTLQVDINIDVPEAGNVLDVLTWNESTTYDHTLTVSLTIDPSNLPPAGE